MRTKAVQVVDEHDNEMAKVIVGDSKANALARLGKTNKDGILLDKDGIGLLETDTITLEGGPYLFRGQDDPKHQLHGQEPTRQSQLRGLEDRAAD